MNRFIGEKSSDFFGGGGFHADAMARESVSRFLTEAVNQIAEDLVKGVDIDINVKNYEAVDNTINRTDLDVALTKRLLNDRLSISVGKNFTVEGSDPISKTQQTNNEQYIPDITTHLQAIERWSLYDQRLSEESIPGTGRWIFYRNRRGVFLVYGL